MKSIPINKEDEKVLHDIWEYEINRDLTKLSFKEWKKVAEPDIGDYHFD